MYKLSVVYQLTNLSSIKKKEMFFLKHICLLNKNLTTGAQKKCTLFFSIIYGKKNNRVILKSPFHYKLVKINAWNPSFSIKIRIVFLTNRSTQYWLQKTKNNQLSNKIIITQTF